MQTRKELLNSEMGNERITVMLLLDIRELLEKQNKKLSKRKYTKREVKHG